MASLLEFNSFKKRPSDSKARRLRLLQSGEFSDCEFLVSASPDNSQIQEIIKTSTNDADKSNDNAAFEPTDQNLYRCHKMVLATASEVFERMFYGNFAEQPSPILVNDVLPEIFELLLEYIYTNTVDPRAVTVQNISEILYVADKYMIHDFSTSCIEILLAKPWNLSDIFPMFEMACLFGNLPLLFKCYELIGQNAKRLLNDQTFYDLNIEYMKRLMVFFSQINEVHPKLVLDALECYCKENDLKNKDAFHKLVDAACCLDFSQLSVEEYRKGPGRSYIYSSK